MSVYGDPAIRVVGPYINSTGSDIPLWTAVELVGTTNNTKVQPVADLDSVRVIGAVIGYFTPAGVLIEDDAPDGLPAAVCTAGIARFLIEGDVDRDQLAYCAATDGTIYSSATEGAGAFGVVIDSASTGAGHTFARVEFPLKASLGAGGTGGGGIEWEDVGSSPGGGGLGFEWEDV